jgi:hypothetical protein
MERTLVQARTVELLDAGLVELSKGEYALAIVMLAKKDIFGNWIKCRMCGDYCSVNKRTHLDKYAMPLQRRSLMLLDRSRFLVPWN